MGVEPVLSEEDEVARAIAQGPFWLSMPRERITMVEARKAESGADHTDSYTGRVAASLGARWKIMLVVVDGREMLYPLHAAAEYGGVSALASAMAFVYATAEDDMFADEKNNALGNAMLALDLGAAASYCNANYVLEGDASEDEARYAALVHALAGLWYAMMPLYTNADVLTLVHTAEILTAAMPPDSRVAATRYCRTYVRDFVRRCDGAGQNVLDRFT